jgi:hypothetical protein
VCGSVYVWTKCSEFRGDFEKTEGKVILIVSTFQANF